MNGDRTGNGSIRFERHDDLTLVARLAEPLDELRRLAERIWPVDTLNPNGKYVTVGGHTPQLLQLVVFGPIVRRLTNKDLRIVGSGS